MIENTGKLDKVTSTAAPLKLDNQRWAERADGCDSRRNDGWGGRAGWTPV